MAYGNEQYRDFHWNKWSQLSREQKDLFGGTKDDYAAYRQEYGLDGFKSAKEKAQAYQFDKKWSQTDDAYKELHTRDQHLQARSLWRNNHNLDYDSTSDAYRMMIDRNTHGQWYNNGGDNPQSSTLPHTGSGQGQGPVTDSYQPPTDDPWDESQLVTTGPQNGSSSSSSSSSSSGQTWDWNNPDAFWDEYNDGQNWGSLSDDEKAKYGDNRRLSYMTDLMGWGGYGSLDERLRNQWEERGGLDAYREARNFVQGGRASSGGTPGWQEETSGGDSGGSGGSGGSGSSGSGGSGGSGNDGDGINIVVEGGNGGGGLSFEEQQQLNEERSKKERISAILSSMKRDGNPFMQQINNAGGAQFNSGFQAKGRQKFTPWGR